MKNHLNSYLDVGKIMKITLTQLLAVILFTTLVQARDIKAQAIMNKTVTLNLTKTSLGTVLDQIEKQTDVKFVYSKEFIQINKQVSINSANRTLNKVLDEILKPLNITYEVINGQIALRRKRFNRGSPEISEAIETRQPEQSAFTVTGTVTSGKGEPLPGVTVVLKGGALGTTTDANGKYSLSLADGTGTLVFSFIGFLQKEVSVNNTSVINVTLTEDAKALEEVVVIGYGAKDRRMLTESIGTVTAQEIQRVPVASPDQALQGRVSGVQVTAVDGTPGAPVSVRIRGVGTVGNTQPLYVIDGIPVGNASGGNTNPLASINPADIESMSVLKDASAAAVYGVRAANGVVLITTKRGRSGRPTVNYDGYYGVQNFPKLYDWNNTQQYMELATEAINNRNTQFGYKPGDKDYIILHPDLRPGSPLLNVNTDWQQAALNENAPMQNHNLSVSGGSDVANFHVSVGYFKQEAMVRKWDLERYNFRVNGDYKIGKRFTFGQTFALAYQEVIRGMNAGGDGFLYAGLANMPPFFSIYEDPANPIPNNRYGFNGNLNVGGLTIANQFGINEILDNTDRRTNMLGGVHGVLEIVSGLKFRTAASIDMNINRNSAWQPGYTALELGLPRETNNYNDNRSEGYTQVFTNTLTYDKTLGDHTINVLGGIEYQKLRSSGLSYRGENFLSTSPAFYRSVNNQSGDSQGRFGNAGSSNFNEAFVGYLGRLSYDYKQKYLLTATVRRDGIASFAPENRWGTFPSVSAAWRISQEPFMAGIPFISDLKLRGSWGQLGNSATSQFPHVFRVSFTPDYGLGNTTQQAPVQVNLPNRNVTWETVETTDVGFDVYMFDNRFNFLATYYNRNTKDFLYFLPISSVAGFTSIPVNAGNVENRGIELEMGYKAKIANVVDFNIGGNLTTIRNRLTALAPGIQEFSSGDYRTAVGFPIGYFYGYQTDGIYQTPDEAATALPDNLASGANNKPRPGDVRFKDVNGPAKEGAPKGQQFSGEPDGKITPADRAYLGKTIPDFFYGLNMGFNAAGFDLNLLFQGVAGVQLYNDYRRSNLGLGGVGRNQMTESLNRWTGPNTSNSLPRAIVGDPAQNNRFSDRWVEDAGFLRLRNIQLGYTLPVSLLQRTKAFRTARVYIAANNLFTITNYSGLDPEVMTYGQNGRQTSAGTDRANMPQPRIFQGGVQLSF